ncbi:hypothetical protein [Gottfriedia acidiceleris]|uniref:hypothetical protein n=1 Tax=Gottfriedia acidiceleris TaxID=371036 RepID=UPI002FFFAE3E
MLSYFFQIIIYLGLIIGMSISIWNFYKKKNSKIIYKKTKKNRKLYQISLKEKFGLVVALMVCLFSSISFVKLVQDLPDAMSQHTKLIQGNCIINRYNGRGGGSLEARFGKQIITFNNNPYYKAHNGNFYCKAEYLPHSYSGISLILYKSKGGKEVVTK